MVEVAGSVPGFSGLFIAGIFAAALSTMSASLNTVAGTIYEDFVKPRLFIFLNFQIRAQRTIFIFYFFYRYPNTSEQKASNIMKVKIYF